MFTNLPPPKFIIALPVPASALKTSYGVDYEKFDIGQGLGSLNELWNPQNGGRGFLEDTSIGDVTAQVIYSVIQGLAGEAGINAGVLNAFIGRAENPYTEQLFKNVEFREHTFTYTFLPKNMAESRRVDDIIQMFKFYMHPVHSGSGVSPFFEFPYEFQITYSVADTTFTLLPSVLQKFDVDYAGYDVPKFFNPGKLDNKQYPAKITINMVFREMTLLTRDRIALNLVDGLRNPAELDDYESRQVTSDAQKDINRTRFRF
jgi:hypothetical protein